MLCCVCRCNLSVKFNAVVYLCILNPIRSGLFQTVNDPGGGGFKSPPPPYDLENYCVNLHHMSM